MSNKTTLTTEPNSPIIRIERIFDAPRDKVFRAFTQKDKIEKWWGENAQIEVDARDGGAWKFTASTDQYEVTFYGFFHEVTAPERIVQTSEFANLGERGHVVLSTYTFTELEDGRTGVLLSEVYSSVEDLQMAVENNMQEGVVRQYNTLDEVFQEM